MKRNSIIKLCFVFVSSYLVFSSCYGDYTKFYEDPQNPGLSIFSNKANNIMTCYVDDIVWRTYDRTYAYGWLSLPRRNYEVYITKLVGNGLKDTLMIEWEGYGSSNFSEIVCKLIVSKNFSYKDFDDLQGQRLSIDMSKGYFANSANNLYAQTIKGTGNIYFHFANLDSLSPNSYQGRLSGLFDADFGSTKITDGRFDHAIDSAQVIF